MGTTEPMVDQDLIQSERSYEDCRKACSKYSKTKDRAFTFACFAAGLAGIVGVTFGVISTVKAMSPEPPTVVYAQTELTQEQLDASDVNVAYLSRRAPSRPLPLKT